MKGYNTVVDGRAFGIAAAFAAAMLTAPAMAAGLRVSAEANPAAAGVNAAAGEYAFAVTNIDSGRLDALRIVADRGHEAQCASVTRNGLAFAASGSLQAGDSVRCVARPRTQSRLRNASVVVLAHDAQGKPVSRPFAFAQPAAVTPAQGVVVLSGGGIFNDSNSNGLLEAGETISYHYTVYNAGTLALSGIAVADIDGPVICTPASLSVNAWTSCTSVHVITPAEQAAGMVFNQVDISATDANGGPVQGGDFVLTQNLGGNAGVRVFKSPLLYDDVDGSGYASAGDVLRYTFVVKNDNAQALGSVNLTEDNPLHIDGAIICNPTTLMGQPFTGLGSGSLQSNDVVLCSADHTITPAEATAGTANNLVEATAAPGVGSPVQGTGASAVAIPTAANVTLSKALTGESGSLPGVVEAGETLTYTLTLSNSGGANAFNVGVTDPLDPNVSFVSASNGGSLSGSTVTWSGLTVPGNGNLVLTVTVTVANPLPSGTTHVLNLAYQTGTTPPDCSLVPLPAGCVNTPTPGAIQIAKALTGESGTRPGIVEPGENLTYTITLSNNGGSTVSGFGVSDPLDANVSFVSADNGGSLSGNTVTWSGLSIPAGGSLVLTVVVQVVDPLPITTTHVVNLAYQTGTTPPDCNTVPVPAGCAITPVQEPPRLQVTKTVNTPSVAPGGAVVFTITVTNVGNVVASNVVVSDPLPSGFASFAWTCAANSGAACSNASGSGAINETIPVFPPAGQLVYTVTAITDAASTGSLLNAVEVTPSSITVCMPAQTPGPCDATASVVVVPAGVPTQVPTANVWALLFMALGLTAFVWRRRQHLPH